MGIRFWCRRLRVRRITVLGRRFSMTLRLRAGTRYNLGQGSQARDGGLNDRGQWHFAVFGQVRGFIANLRKNLRAPFLQAARVHIETLRGRTHQHVLEPFELNNCLVPQPLDLIAKLLFVHCVLFSQTSSRV